MEDVDPRAVMSGAVAALTFAVPLVVIAGIFEWRWIGIFLWVLWIFAGYVAGSKRPDLPYTHGVLAGVATYAITQAIGVLFTIARGNDLHPVLYVFNAFLAAALGLVGGMVAERRNARMGGV